MAHRGSQTLPHHGPASPSRHCSDCPLPYANTRRKGSPTEPIGSTSSKVLNLLWAWAPAVRARFLWTWVFISFPGMLSLRDRQAAVAGPLPYGGRSDVPWSWQCSPRWSLLFHTLFSLHCLCSTHHTCPSPCGLLHTTLPSCIHSLRYLGLGHEKGNQGFKWGTRSCLLVILLSSWKCWTLLAIHKQIPFKVSIILAEAITLSRMTSYHLDLA